MHCYGAQLNGSGRLVLGQESTIQFRMVAEPRLTMREGPEGPGAMDDRETLEVYMEETEETYNVYRMV
eukprot:5067975-Amphidinium_carterae.2